MNRNLKDNKRARIYEGAQMIKNVAYKPKNKPIKTIMDELNPTKYDEIKKITQLRTVKVKNQSFIVEGDIIQQNKSHDLSHPQGNLKNNSGILCKATRSGSSIGRSLYVTARGYVMPCCWMGTDNDMKLAARTFAKGLDPKMHSIYHYETMSDILNLSLIHI